VRHRYGSSTLTWAPGPCHQFVFGQVLDQLVEVPVPVLLRVLDRPANLRIGQTLPDHGSAGRRQAPVGSARRQMRARKVVVLMTGAALFRRNSVTAGAAPHVHRMRMTIVSLPREVSLGMAVHASRVSQHRDKCGKESSIALRRRCRSILRGWRRRHGERQPEPAAENDNTDEGGDRTGDGVRRSFHTASVKRMGRRRIRFPVTANRALAMAGAAQGTPGSPIPPDFSSLSTM